MEGITGEARSLLANLNSITRKPNQQRSRVVPDSVHALSGKRRAEDRSFPRSAGDGTGDRGAARASFFDSCIQMRLVPGQKPCQRTMHCRLRKVVRAAYNWPKDCTSHSASPLSNWADDKKRQAVQSPRRGYEEFKK